MASNPPAPHRTAGRRCLLLNTAFALTLTAMLAQPLHAETPDVCTTGECEFSSVQAAIDASEDGDIINIAPGVYKIVQTIDTKGKAVTIRGSVDPVTYKLLTALDGQGMQRVLTCINEEGPDTVFEYLVIQNGYVPGNGGGMYSTGSPTLTACRFLNNSAEGDGGGMYNDENSPVITRCAFEQNASGHFGGGMYNDESAPTLIACAFTANSAAENGGGLYNGSSSPTLTKCTFAKNHARYGGAMHNESGSPIFIDCTVEDNHVP